MNDTATIATTVESGGRHCMPTRQTQILYDLLLSRMGQMVSYDEIDRVLGTNAKRTTLLIWVLICNIRDHLPPRQEIHSGYGKGYRLITR